MSGGFSGEVVGATLAGLIQMLMHYTNVQLSVICFFILIFFLLSLLIHLEQPFNFVFALIIFPIKKNICGNCFGTGSDLFLFLFTEKSLSPFGGSSHFTSLILPSGWSLIRIRFLCIVYRLLLFACFAAVFFIRFNQLIFHAFPKLLSLNFMHDGHAMSEWKP